MDSAKRVINGTWGEVWLTDAYVGEVYGLQAKGSFNKSTVNRVRQLAEDKKITSVSYTGSLKMHKVNSRMARLIGSDIKAGKDPRFVILSKLDDPDA